MNTTLKVCLLAISLPVCLVRAEIIRTDVNPQVPVLRDEQGKYILKDGGIYTVSGTIDGDIEGHGDIGVRMSGGTVINGCVDLQYSSSSRTRRVPRIWIDYTCRATINNSGKIALQTGRYRPTFIEYCGTLTVNGNVSGSVQITDGGTTLIVQGEINDGFAYLNKETWLRVKGPIQEGVEIRAEYDRRGNEANITNSYTTEGDYRVYYGGDVPEFEP